MKTKIDGPRACTKTEISEVVAIVDLEMRQGQDQTMRTDHPHVYCNNNLENVQIIKVNKKIVSVVPFVPHRIKVDSCEFSVGIISPTATVPEHRKKGYALKCLNAAIERMVRDQIEISALWTQIPTFKFYGNRDYEAVRCQTLCYQCTASDAKGFFCCDDVEIFEYESSNSKYIDDIRALYENGGGSVIRSRERFKVVLSLPKIGTLLAIKNGRAEAYLVVSKASNKPGILEGSGQPQYLETLVHKALAELDDQAQIKAYVSLEPTPLGALLARKMPNKAQSEEIGQMMVRINNIKGFFSQISPWLVKKNASVDRSVSIEISDTGEVISFVFSKGGLKLAEDKLSEHLVVTLRELVSIVFGPHPERPVDMPDIVKGLFPFYFTIYILDHS